MFYELLWTHEYREISVDPAKRKKTLQERQLDFAETPTVFGGRTFTVRDDRRDHGEMRWITVACCADGWS